MLRFLQEKIFAAGIHADTPFVMRNRLRIYNSANFIIMLISVLYSVLAIIQGYTEATVATTFFVVACIVCIVLVNFGKIHAAIHIIFWCGYIFLSFFTVLFGVVTNSHLYYLFMIVAANLMFDRTRTILFYSVLGLLFLLSNVYYMMEYKPLIPYEKWMDQFGYPNIIFVSLMIYLGVRLFKTENLRYANKIEEQKQSLEEKNKEITDSINYAKKIQTALIPSESEFNSCFRESFVFLRPKDIVSGDFYWYSVQDDLVFFAAADCTGHGVPGGFMTMLGISFLDEIVNEKKIYNPAAILDQLRDRIIHTLRQTGATGESRDGMDITLCVYDRRSHKINYAAANNHLFVFSKSKDWQKFPADKQPCGFHPDFKPFTLREVQTEEEDCVFLFSDGYADQFGGPRGKKLKYKILEELLAGSSHQPLHNFPPLLDKHFSEWKGMLEQVDDVLVIGVRV